MRKELLPTDREHITSSTLNHYEAHAERFWLGTKDHDVTQNYAALLEALPQRPGLRILDLGCGPGRDLLYFKNIGHQPTGLDGALEFCKMAREYSGCPVLHQDFLELALPESSFDGIFANASLFHVPRRELVRVLGDLREALVPDGALFSSNPRGRGEGRSGGRYAAYYEWEEYRGILDKSRFDPLHHYYRPAGLPPEHQPWLAVVCRPRLAPHSRN